MLGAIVSSRLSARPETFFRYSVKCDRAMASRIETAAKKAGLSVSAFVQQHFDTILDPRQDRGEGAAFKANVFDPVSFSRRYQIPVFAAQVWIALKARADADGLVRVPARTLAEKLGFSGDLVRKGMNALIDAGRLEPLEPMIAGRPALYRVVGEG